MAIQLGSAFGKVVLDASGVKKGVASAKTDLQSLADIGAKVGESMSNVGRKMTLGLTLPILAAGTASIKMASDLEESKNKVLVVFGSMSDSVLAWSKTSATAFGQSQQAALEAAGTFGNLFTTMGLGADESAEMSMRLVELAGDLASFNNIDPTIALEKLRAGLVGEVEPLRTLGVNLLASQVQAKAMAMGLADANGELSQQALVLARYQLILEQTTNSQGDFARTSDGMANQSRILRAQLQNLLAEMGDNLLPIAVQLVQFMNLLLGLFVKMPEPVQGLVIVSLALVAALGPLLLILGSIISTVSTLIVSWPAITAAFTALAAVVTGTVIPALAGMAAAAAPVILIILLIGAAIALLALAWKTNFAFMRDNVRVWANSIKLLWAALLAFLKGDTAKATELVKQAWGGMVDELQRRIEKYAPWLMTAWGKLMAWLPQAAATAVRSILAVFNIPWWQIGQNMIVGIIQGWLSGVNALIAIVTNTLDMVVAGINDALEMGSPSRKTFQQGKWAGEGFALGWAAALDGADIARRTERSVTNVSNSSRQTTMNFGNGITVHEAEGMIERRLNQAFEGLYYNLGGK